MGLAVTVIGFFLSFVGNKDLVGRLGISDKNRQLLLYAVDKRYREKEASTSKNVIYRYGDARAIEALAKDATRQAARRAKVKAAAKYGDQQAIDKLAKDAERKQVLRNVVKALAMDLSSGKNTFDEKHANASEIADAIAP